MPGLPSFARRDSVSLLRPPRGVALPAVDRLAVGRIERDLGLLAAAVAGHVVEGALAALAGGSLPLVAARLATLGLVGETLASVKLLIIGGEQKGSAAVDTSQILIRVLLHHGRYRSPGFLSPGPGGCPLRHKRMTKPKHSKTVRRPAPAASSL